jgi:NADPH:quinone reductase-like Zn-dependent oxidoreductase
MVMATLNQEDLATVRDLMAAGEVTPVIDRHFSLAEVPDAIRYSEQGHARGKIVIEVE